MNKNYWLSKNAENRLYVFLIYKWEGDDNIFVLFKLQQNITDVQNVYTESTQRVI